MTAGRGNVEIHNEPVHGVAQYLTLSRMDCDGVYGTEQEIMYLSHLLNTPVYMYTTQLNYIHWNRYEPSTIDPLAQTQAASVPAMYFRHDADLQHYEVVLGVLPMVS